MNSFLVTVAFVLIFCAAVPVALLWRSRTASLVAFGIVSFGLLVLALQILGILAFAAGAPFVTLTNLLIVSAIFCAISWGIGWKKVARRRPAPRAGASRPHGGRDSKHGGKRGGKGGSKSSRKRAAKKAASSRPAVAAGVPQTDTRVLLGVAVVCGIFLAVAVSSALSSAPRDWDVLTYHLPRTASWLLNGDLGIYGSTGAFYPANGELPMLALFFSGSDRLVPLVQLPFGLLGALALYGIARRLGASRVSAAVPVVVFLMSPLVFFQSTIAKNDLTVTGLVLASTFFLIRSLDVGPGSKDRMHEMLAAGFALGLAFGTKYSILPFVLAAVPLVFVVHALLASSEGPAAARRAAVLIGAFVAAMLVPSAFWFVRNIVITGNPIEPLSPVLGSWIESSGLGQEFQFVSARMLWWVYPFMDTHIDETYSGSAGFGAAFAVLFLPGLVLCVRGALNRKLDAAFRTSCLAIAGLVAVAVLGWWFGKHHLPRFLLPAMALACIPMAFVFEGVSRKARSILAVVLAAAVLFSALETLRIVFRDEHHIWSHHHGKSRAAHYRMPPIIYRLPVGTRILLLAPTAHNFYQTYRYPLVGSLPGNDIVMEEDVGVDFDIKKEGALDVYRDLIDTEIEYVFMRTVGLKPFTTWFDNFPELYEPIVDEVERSYPWYRVSIAVTPEGEVLGGGTVVTKMYRVRKAGEAPPAPVAPAEGPIVPETRP